MGKTFKAILFLFPAFMVIACGDIDENDDRPAAVQPPPVEETLNPDIPGTITVRDADGGLVADNLFSNPEDVYLFGVGLQDGTYFYQITDPGCTTLLAGPAPSAGIPDTGRRRITVFGGGFTEPVQLAPFNITPNEDGRYIAAIVPVVELATEDVGCFGFPDDWRETGEFRIAP